MAIRKQSLTVNFLVWDTENNCGKTGVASSIELKIVKNGATPEDTENNAAEVNQSSMPGIYQIELTADEMDGDFICVSGVVSGAQNTGVVVYPAFIQTESNMLNDILSRIGEMESQIDAIPPIPDNIASTGDIDNAKQAIIEAITQSEDRVTAAINQSGNGITTAIADLQGTINSGVKLNQGGVADVKTGALAALRDHVLTEPASMPGQAPKLDEAIMVLYMALRNKTDNSSTLMRIFRNNGQSFASADLTDDAGVFTKDVLS